MSRQYDAKQHVLKAYPSPTDPVARAEAIELFLDFLEASESEFEYGEGMSPEEYIYGKEPPPSICI